MEAVAYLAAVAALGVACQKIVEFLRTLIPVSGQWVRLGALAVGTGLAWTFALDPTGAVATGVGLAPRDLPAYVDYLIGGVSIGAAAGYFADRAGRSNGAVVIE